MPTDVGVKLLSALRKSGSTSAVKGTPEIFFADDAERQAYLFLRGFIEQFKAFPSPDVFRRNTGITTVTTTQPLDYYLSQARDRALYKEFLAPFEGMYNSMRDKNPQAVLEAARQLVSVGAALSTTGSEFVSLDQAVDRVIKDFHEASMTFGLRGITTGWPYVDDVTDGWQSDDVITFVGRPGRGKTYILLFMAYAAWLAGYSVLFVSMELGAIQLARRLVGIHTKVDPNLIRKGTITTSIRQEFLESMGGLRGGVPFNIIVGGFKKSVMTIEAVAEAVRPDIIFADASYLLTPEKRRKFSDSRREIVSDVIEDIKRLNLAVHCPIVQSVQFNRSAEKPKKSTEYTPLGHLNLSKIGETDVIGQSSSIVVGIENYEPPHERNRKWLGFLKGREGETGIWAINYRFQPVDLSIVHVGAAPSTPRQEGPDLSYMR